jgi:CMP-N-acetylneuraminic acid synthetase
VKPSSSRIFARGGSKGVPTERQMIAGKPLIAHAIVAAQASTAIVNFCVDDDQRS